MGQRERWISLDLRDRALIALIAGVGLKAGQAIALNLEDLDVQTEETGTVRVQGRRGREEVVALPPAVTADLVRYVADGRPLLVRGAVETGQPPPLFPNARGKRLSRQGLWLVLKGRGEAAGLKDVSPRALRGACE